MPALCYLGDGYNIQGVYSRSNNNHDKIKRNWNVTTSTNIDDFNLKRIDWIIIAVNLDQVPVVTNKLLSLGLSNKVIFLDTPVINIDDIFYISSLKRFKNVYVTEESIVMPQFCIAKKLINEGKIGELKGIWLFHSGFKYHAIATIRSFLGKKRILKAQSYEITKNCYELTIKFNGGVRATILEPRNYSSGRFLISGTDGLISDYDINNDMTDSSVYKISYLKHNGVIKGFILNGEEIKKNRLDRKFFEMLDVNIIPNPSEVNQLKIWALMKYFELSKLNIDDQTYKYKDGLYDNYLINIMNKINWWYDLPVYFNCSLTSAFIKTYISINKIINRNA